MKLSKQEVQRRQRTKSGLLDEAEVAHIKWRIDQGEDKRQIAQDFLVAVGTIRSIGRGDTWAWVAAEPPSAPLTQEELEASKAEFLARLDGKAPDFTTAADQSAARFRAKLGGEAPKLYEDPDPADSRFIDHSAAERLLGEARLKRKKLPEVQLDELESGELNKGDSNG